MWCDLPVMHDGPGMDEGRTLASGYVASALGALQWLAPNPQQVVAQAHRRRRRRRRFRHTQHALLPSEAQAAGEAADPGGAQQQRATGGQGSASACGGDDGGGSAAQHEQRQPGGVQRRQALRALQQQHAPHIVLYLPDDPQWSAVRLVRGGAATTRPSVRTATPCGTLRVVQLPWLPARGQPADGPPQGTGDDGAATIRPAGRASAQGGPSTASTSTSGSCCQSLPPVPVSGPGCFLFHPGVGALQPALKRPVLLVADLDTVVSGGGGGAGAAACQRLAALWQASRAVQPGSMLVLRTQRGLEAWESMWRQRGGRLPAPDVLAADGGTRLYLRQPGGSYAHDAAWLQHLEASGWRLEAAQQVAAALVATHAGDVRLAPRSHQGPCRVQLKVRAGRVPAVLAAAERLLAEHADRQQQQPQTQTQTPPQQSWAACQLQREGGWVLVSIVPAAAEAALAHHLSSCWWGDAAAKLWVVGAADRPGAWSAAAASSPVWPGASPAPGVCPPGFRPLLLGQAEGQLLPPAATHAAAGTSASVELASLPGAQLAPFEPSSHSRREAGHAAACDPAQPPPGDPQCVVTASRGPAGVLAALQQLQLV
jgi:hypothetical protein